MEESKFQPFIIQPLPTPPPPALPPMIFRWQKYPMRWVKTISAPECVYVTITCYDGRRYRCDVTVPISYERFSKFATNEIMLRFAFGKAHGAYHKNVFRRNKLAWRTGVK